MRLLNTKQKIAAYKWAMKQLKDFYPHYYHQDSDTVAPYVCDLLRRHFEKHKQGWCDREELLETNFPEFLSCKPENLMPESKWWGEDDEGILMRAVALEWCIEQLTSK